MQHSKRFEIEMTSFNNTGLCNIQSVLKLK